MAKRHQIGGISIYWYWRQLMDIHGPWAESDFFRELKKLASFQKLLKSISGLQSTRLGEGRFWQFVDEQRWLLVVIEQAREHDGPLDYDELGCFFPRAFRKQQQRHSVDWFVQAFNLYAWVKTAGELGIFRCWPPRPVKVAKCWQLVAQRFRTFGSWHEVLGECLPFQSVSDLRAWVTECRVWATEVPEDALAAFIGERPVSCGESTRAMWRHPCGWLLTHDTFIALRHYCGEQFEREQEAVAELYRQYCTTYARTEERFADEVGFGIELVLALIDYHFGSLANLIHQKSGGPETDLVLKQLVAQS